VSGGGVSGSTVSGSAGSSTGVAGILAAVGGTGSATTAGTGTQPSTGGHGVAGAAGTGTGATAGASGAAGTSAGVAGATAGSGGAGGAAAGKGGSGGATSGAGGASGRSGQGGSGGSGQGGSGASGATFTAVYKIFMTNCSGGTCHVSPTGAAGGLSMPDQMKAYMNLVGVNSMSCTGEKRVVAGDAAKSELVHTLDRTTIGTCGARTPKMPDNKPKLAQADIDTITAWITAGAMNN
jgi:hypothetical protein